MFLQGGGSMTLEPTSSIRDVTYSCGYCGYALNLSSSNRNTSSITSKYRKTIKKGVISFVSIDETRFSQSEELSCIPYFTSKHSWGLFRRRTKLNCRKCGGYIGCIYSCSSFGPESSASVHDNKVITVVKEYDIKIGALQPSSEESSTTFLAL